MFESSKANISEHISNIYKEGELEKDSTVRKIRTVQKEGNRNVTRERIHYNLDLILSVGYRVKSKTATKFRIWATSTLRDYLTKGYGKPKKIILTDIRSAIIYNQLLTELGIDSDYQPNLKSINRIKLQLRNYK